LVLLLAAALAGIYAAWTAYRVAAVRLCDVCRRPVEARTRTVGLMGNRREKFCCPACALTAHLQGGQTVRLIELTDYETGAGLPPEQAYLVKDSDVNPCARPHTMPDEMMHPLAQHFDRCSPGLVAFGRKAAAERFAAEHGGTVLPYQEMAAAYRQ
jgi:hypothetical protein